MIFFFKIDKIIETQGETFDWKNRTELGINEEAWRKIKKSKIHPLHVFCSPRILGQYSSLLRYYRSIAMIPQKGLQNISRISNIKEIENGKKSINPDRVKGLVILLNEFTSSNILLSEEITKEKVSGMMYATAGTSIDGSWRNQIGNEGERVIRTLLVKSFIENHEILAIVSKKDISFKVKDWTEEFGSPIETIKQMKSVVLINGSSMLFSSEPDVKLIDYQGNTIGAIEIKAGIDPAGALERLGAMFKSFDNVLAVTPSAATILVATCITDEVDARLRESNAVKQTYITTDIINNKSGKAKKLANTIRGVLGLISKRM
ncbi:MAG: XcyI family restriction endonuclease [Bacteroidota bacterium]